MSNEDQLRNQLIERINELLENKLIDTNMRLSIKKDGRTQFITKKITDPIEYLNARLDRLRKHRPESTEYDLLQIIANEPSIGLNLAIEKKESDEIFDNVKLGDLRDGDVYIYTKGKVIYAKEDISKKNPKYQYMRLTIQDDTGKVQVFLSKVYAMNKMIFTAFSNNDLIGKVLQFKGAVYRTTNPKYEPTLTLPDGSYAEIIDEDIKVKDIIHKIIDLGKENHNRNVMIVGKVFNPKVFTAENENKTRYIRFMMSDTIKDGSTSLALTGFTTAVDKILEAENKVIKLECKYSFKDDFNSNPTAVVFNDENITILNKDPNEYPEEIEYSNVNVNRLIDAKDGDIYEGIVYLDNFKSQQWSLDESKFINCPPFVPICKLPHNPEIDWKRGVKTNDDGQLQCLGCEKILDPENDTEDQFQITASIYDGEICIQNVRIVGKNAEKIFEISEEELIKNYSENSHENFFMIENERSGGKLFKIKGLVKFAPSKSGGYLNFSIYNVEKISLDDALQYEMNKIIE